MTNGVCLCLQFTPRYLIQSTWLDETINAVVAGLNTAVYVRDLTPRPVRRKRRRKTGESQQCFMSSLDDSLLGFGFSVISLLFWHRNSIRFE